MSSLSEIYFKKETLQTILNVLEKKGEAGLKVTVSINDESKVFTTKEGKEIYQNVSAYVSQSEEDRKAKKERFFVANGKCFWTDGNIVVAGKPQEQEQQQASGSSSEAPTDLPF